MSMTPPSLHRRRLLAGAVGIPALAAVLSVSLANALISVKLVDAAAAVPMGAAIAARSADARDLSVELSARALRESTIVQPALTHLALNEARPRGDRLLALSARLGWRDAETQRRLYAMAVRHGNCPAALSYASALMRQGVGFDTLAPAVTHAAALPACQPALLALMRHGEPWAPAWLRRHGADLSPAIQSQIVAAIHPGRETWAPLVDQRLAKGQSVEAYNLWQQAGETTSAPNRLDWPGVGARLYPTAFDWTIAPDMALSDGLLSPASEGVGVAVRRLLLAPGAYLLSTGAPGDAALGWRWGLSCGLNPMPAPTEALRPRQAFTITAACPTPWLTLAGGEGPISAPTLRFIAPAR
ncbi:MAG: hypothetical protein ABT10_08130 [Novosphingobium sp. SCN 63-17]|uniref:hypothetical protein n=2 Tax=unclassified Novosphingobium TaxID=2644732 RepID=UPI00086A6A86|nr:MULTISPECIES: hypothetical protein [unclassified Novosphingobium]MBN9145390.1 hypothetical protein [Novosphingobium sp.]ODU83146.1 MAG: hypothetical protein ABT10_08130 [Novosphingobium sp. SCN 63-17]OJX88112.1 MAG: hypothetical protein BGP00_02010 [Novosphingobium sp. 63-713]